MIWVGMRTSELRFFGLEMKKAPGDWRLDMILNRSEYSTAGGKVKGLVHKSFFWMGSGCPW